MRRASRLLDDQLKHIQRLVDDGSSGRLLEAKLIVLLQWQIEDRETRLELLDRTTRLLTVRGEPSEDSAGVPPPRELRPRHGQRSGRYHFPKGRPV